MDENIVKQYVGKHARIWMVGDPNEFAGILTSFEDNIVLLTNSWGNIHIDSEMIVAIGEAI